MYTVGSLSDLISGNDTPNKQAVKIREVKVSKNKKIKENIEILKNGKQGNKGKKEKNQNRKTAMDTTINTAENNLKDIKSKNKNKKIKQDVETEETITMPTTKKPIKKMPIKKNKKLNDKSAKKEKMELKQNIETTMETTEDIQKENLNNGKKSKMLKRKANETDMPKTDTNKKIKLDNTQTENVDKDNNRTVFVGNVPLSSKPNDLRRFFSSYGEIESLRFRGIPVANMITPKKIAFMRKEFHHKRKSMIAYVCFKSSESAVRAKKADGKKFNNFHLRVDKLGENVRYDNTKSVFIGNVPFDAEEEDVRKLFADCGKVARVRLVRDNKTNMGKGFGYVKFDSTDAVDLALQLGTVELGKRELRIARCYSNEKKTNKTADGRKLRERYAIYIFDLPKHTTETELRELFQKCGKVLSTRIIESDQTHCYVNFEDPEGVRNALNMQNPTLHGVPVQVKSKVETNTEQKQKPAVYIRNLPLMTTKEQIHEIFKDCGTISFIRLLLKKTRPTGVGFVNFENEDAIEKALQKKVTIGNSQLMITRKTDEPKAKKRPSKLKNQVKEEIEEETELLKDLTTEKKWDDDVSSSDDDEESEVKESSSVLTMSEDDESGVEETESDDSDDGDVKKKPKKKENAQVTPKGSNINHLL